MKRQLALSAACLLLCKVAWADEYYEFWHVTCDSYIQSLEFRRVGFWNIGELVWEYGGDGWPAHVSALKRLEEKSNLHVFDDAFGYYDAPRKTFECGSITATLDFQKVPRDDGEYFRGSTLVTLRFSGQIAIRGVLISSVRNLKAYLVANSGPYLRMCLPEGCQDVAEVWWPVTPESLSRVPFTAELLERGQ